MKIHEFRTCPHWSDNKMLHKIQADTLEEAVYKYVRKTHTFLTDDNHTWDAGKQTVYWAGEYIDYYSLRIIRNEKSTPPAIKNHPFSLGDNPGEPWFAVEYWPVKKRNKNKVDKEKVEV